MPCHAPALSALSYHDYSDRASLSEPLRAAFPGQAKKNVQEFDAKFQKLLEDGKSHFCTRDSGAPEPKIVTEVAKGNSVFAIDADDYSNNTCYHWSSTRGENETRRIMPPPPLLASIK